MFENVKFIYHQRKPHIIINNDILSNLPITFEKFSEYIDNWDYGGDCGIDISGTYPCFNRDNYITISCENTGNCFKEDESHIKSHIDKIDISSEVKLKEERGPEPSLINDASIAIPYEEIFYDIDKSLIFVKTKTDFEFVILMISYNEPLQGESCMKCCDNDFEPLCLITQIINKREIIHNFKLFGTGLYINSSLYNEWCERYRTSYICLKYINDYKSRIGKGVIHMILEFCM